jgi:pesticin/yersiniabactin receptor
VQSVELLRGPQGTLYGKSAQGGIINIVTQQPDSTPRGYIEGGVSSRDSYRSKLNLSGPIQDGLLYGSVTLLRQVDDGEMINPSTGSDDLGGTRASIGNVKLRLAPDDQPWEMGFPPRANALALHRMPTWHGMISRAVRCLSARVHRTRTYGAVLTARR